MRALRLLFVAAVTGGALLVLGPAAGAANSAKVCQTFDTLQEELDEVDVANAKTFDLDAMEEVGDAFHKAAKKAPKRVKSALTTLGDVYEAVGGSGSDVGALQAFGKNGQKYTKALTTFATYYGTRCS